MHFLISLIPTLIVLGILIIIHEFGHFIACRLTGVRVEKFSIGFGPEILHWQGKQTRYAISLLPLGGFVKPAGESISEVESSGPKAGDYIAAPLLVRIFIVVAGVAMNYILAFIIFVFLLLWLGAPGTKVGGMVEGYPAATSGLQVHDRIVSVNGQGVETWMDLLKELQKYDGPISLEVERGHKIFPISIVPVQVEGMDPVGKTFKTKRIGIQPEPNVLIKVGPGRALREAFHTEVYLAVKTHEAIFQLIAGKLSIKAISGPIGIVSMTGTAVQLGLPYLLQLTATLSVSLAVINLFPIPALDGGHLLFLLIEATRRKRVSLRFQERATQIGFVLLLMFMTFVIYNDLVNIDAFDKLRGMFLKP